MRLWGTRIKDFGSALRRERCNQPQVSERSAWHKSIRQSGIATPIVPVPDKDDRIVTNDGELERFDVALLSKRGVAHMDPGLLAASKCLRQLRSAVNGQRSTRFNSLAIFGAERSQ